MIKIVQNKEEANCITHSGTIHADEVFATAFLELYLTEVKLLRTTEIKSEDNKDGVYIYDIGGGCFDHHQENAKRRENEIKYSSFGLLWKEYGRDFLKQQQVKNIEKVFTDLDKDFIEGIDAIDNGVFPKIESIYKVKTISDIIKLFNPSYGSIQNETDQFLKVETIAKQIFEEELLSVIGKSLAKERIQQEILEAKDHTLILKEYMPYEETLLNTDAPTDDIFFVIFPSNRGGYAIKTIPKSTEDHTSRVEFPLAWAGLMNQELVDTSGISGMHFCHINRFLVSCNTLETAKEVVKKSLEEQNSH